MHSCMHELISSSESESDSSDTDSSDTDSSEEAYRSEYELGLKTYRIRSHPDVPFVWVTLPRQSESDEAEKAYRPEHEPKSWARGKPPRPRVRFSKMSPIGRLLSKLSGPVYCSGYNLKDAIEKLLGYSFFN